MNSAETTVAEMHIDEDGILVIRIKKGSHLTLEKSQEYYEVSNRLMEGKKALVLVDASEDYTITDEARAYGSSEQAVSNRLAVAFVTSSTANKLLFRLYVAFNKPKVPTKMFTNKKSALKWLKTFFIMPGDKYQPKKKK
jgi:hypothetical protein